MKKFVPNIQYLCWYNKRQPFLLVRKFTLPCATLHKVFAVHCSLLITNHKECQKQLKKLYSIISASLRPTINYIQALRVQERELNILGKIDESWKSGYNKHKTVTTNIEKQLKQYNKLLQSL